MARQPGGAMNKRDQREHCSDDEDGERSRKLPARTTASPTKKANPYATAVDIGDFVTNEEFTDKLGKRTAQELLFLVQLQVRCSSAYFLAGCVVTTTVVAGLAVGRPHPDGDHCDWHHRPGRRPGPLPAYAETGTAAPCRRGVTPSDRESRHGVHCGRPAGQRSSGRRPDTRRSHRGCASRPLRCVSSLPPP